MRTEISRPRSVAEPRPGLIVPVFSRLERPAIAIGIKDGRFARSLPRADLSIFFARVKPDPHGSSAPAGMIAPSSEE